MPSPEGRRTRPAKTRGDEVLNQIWESEVYSIGTIDEEHMMIHKGLSYTYSNYYSDIDTPSGVKFVLFPTGSTYRAHLDVQGILSGQAGRFTIFETGAVTVTGSDEVTPINRKRTSSNVAGTLLYEGSVVFRSGTKLLDDYIAAGNKLSDSLDHKEEYYLAPNKYYLVSLIPLADNATGSIHLNWYEEQEE
jgi:hypothetical protein